MFELLSDYTVQIVVLGSAVTGATSGALGCFAYLRRQSLVGDVISHSSLLGIVGFFWLWFLLTGDGNKSLWVLIPGAMVAAIGAMILTQWITKSTKIKPDASLGVMLAIFFGSGLTLLRWIQRSANPIPGQAGLEDYLFGMAAATTLADLWMIGMLTIISSLCLFVCWSRLKLLTFDPQYAAGLGLSVGIWELLLLSLLVIGIVIGLQIVGVVLMVALLIAPASAARQWTHSLGKMVLLAALIGAVCAASGALASSVKTGIPTGPAIVVFLMFVVLVSVLFAPGRGALSRRRNLVT
ncbi:MAG: metal ABC transporter permease [Planctomycetaceae bacterium]|nr:metal ABC transporter permease [Planctomycetaceae bacterium]